MEKVKVDKRKQLWKNLLGYMAVGLDIKYYVEEIYSSCSSEKERLHSCAYQYVCKPDSSWEHLTSVLYKEGEMTAVDQARPFLPPRG